MSRCATSVFHCIHVKGKGRREGLLHGLGSQTNKLCTISMNDCINAKSISLQYFGI